MGNKPYFIAAITLGAIGLGLTVFGLKDIIFPRPPVVEIVKSGESNESPTPSPTIVVDVGGAVEKPGVYTLPLGSRISDCLVAAGGLSVAADKNYLSRHINLASIVPDGTKIYILKKGESPSPLQEPASTSIGASSNPSSNLISINSASQSELETLWGIGPARAKSIYDHRPYTSIEEIKSKADVPDNVFEEIKDQITL